MTSMRVCVCRMPCHGHGHGHGHMICCFFTQKTDICIQEHIHLDVHWSTSANIQTVYAHTCMHIRECACPCRMMVFMQSAHMCAHTFMHKRFTVMTSMRVCVCWMPWCVASFHNNNICVHACKCLLVTHSMHSCCSACACVGHEAYVPVHACMRTCTHAHAVTAMVTVTATATATVDLLTPTTTRTTHRPAWFGWCPQRMRHTYTHIHLEQVGEEARHFTAFVLSLLWKVKSEAQWR